MAKKKKINKTPAVERSRLMFKSLLEVAPWAKGFFSGFPHSQIGATHAAFNIMEILERSLTPSIRKTKNFKIVNFYYKQKVKNGYFDFFQETPWEKNGFVEESSNFMYTRPKPKEKIQKVFKPTIHKWVQKVYG